MAALNFPTSPQSGDSYSANGTTWVFDGVSWTSTVTTLTLGSAYDESTTGPELLTNPTFDGNADGWTLGGCTTYSNGTIVVLNSADENAGWPIFSQIVALTAGKVYCLTVNVAAFNNDEAIVWLYTLDEEYTVPCRSVHFASLGENKAFITVATTQSVELSIQPWNWYVNAGFTVTSVSLNEVITPSTGLTLFDANGYEMVDFNAKRFLGTSNLYIGSVNPNDGVVQSTVAVGDKAASICTSEGIWHYGSVGNTAIGTQSLENCTGAFWNTAIGVFSLMSNSGVRNSYSNAALGYGSLMKLGIGSPSADSYSNTAVGAWAGCEMVSGIYNTFAGASAGVWTDTTGYSYTIIMKAASKSVAVGAYSSIPNNALNCISIGYEARCTENNSVVLGNNNITKTFLKGNVSIGAVSPGAKLDVQSTTEQLRLGYDVTHYGSFTVNSSGNLLIDAVGVVKVGDGTNYAQFATDGTMTLQGTATAWDDLLVEMKESLKGTKEKPDWDATNFGFLFPQNDTSEYIVFNVQLPHKWKEGSTVYPHVHIFQNQNVTPTFKIDYRWVNIGDAVPSFTTGYTMGTIIGSQTWTSGLLHRVVGNATGISGSGKTMSSMLQIKLYRDDNTYSDDCLVVSFDVHIEIDSFGSSAEYVK